MKEKLSKYNLSSIDAVIMILTVVVCIATTVWFPRAAIEFKVHYRTTQMIIVHTVMFPLCFFGIGYILSMAISHIFKLSLPEKSPFRVLLIVLSIAAAIACGIVFFCFYCESSPIRAKANYLLVRIIINHQELFCLIGASAFFGMHRIAE